MPLWVDLSKHDAALQVEETQQGKFLVLRATGATPLPDSITQLGFMRREMGMGQDMGYVRQDLRFSLTEIQAHFPHFPQAVSREFALAEILYAPPAPAAGLAPAAAAAAPVVVEPGVLFEGEPVDLVVDGTPVAFYQRRLSRYEAGARGHESVRTWALAYLDGAWQSLGRPWDKGRPTRAELASAIKYRRVHQSSFDPESFFSEVNAQIREGNQGVEDPVFRTPTISPAVFAVQPLDAESFLMRFQDPAEPFVALIEYQSPGVYMPRLNRESSGSGPSMCLHNALCWAVQGLERLQAHNALLRAACDAQAPRWDVDKDSFVSLFGQGQEAGDDAATLARLRTKLPKLEALQDNVKLTRLGPEKVQLLLDDADAGHQVVVMSAAPVAGETREYTQRRMKADQALARALDRAAQEFAWRRVKAERPDGGRQLQALADRRALFMRQRAPDRFSGLVDHLDREFARAIVDKNVEALRTWIARPKGDNEMSKAFFTEATGVTRPGTAKAILAALHTWAGLSPEQAEQHESRRAEDRRAASEARQQASALEWVLRHAENQQVRHNGEVKTAKAFIDEVIEAGYDRLETAKRGAVMRYRLVKQDEGRLYEISGKMVDYARYALQQRLEARPEVKEDAPVPALRMV